MTGCYKEKSPAGAGQIKNYSSIASDRINDLSFFASEISGDGYNALAFFKNNASTAPAHLWLPHEQVDGDAVAAPQKAGEAFSCYFTPAGFAQAGTQYAGRKDEFISSLKSLWLDIDCGEAHYANNPDTCYLTQKEALTRVVELVSAGVLPEPSFVVNSGTGWHLYFVLASCITLPTWRALTRRMVTALREELKFDAGCSLRASGILRLPGSWNQKAGKRAEIVLASGRRYSVRELEQVFPSCDTPGLMALGERPAFLIAEGVSPDDVQAQVSLPPSTFSVAASRCGQLRQALQNPAGREEPLWRADLSIAVNCIDGEEAIHQVSRGHAGYSHAATCKKAAAVRGKPYTCEVYHSLNPAGCAGCRHAEKIGSLTSPIMLGVQLEEESRQAVRLRAQQAAERAEKAAQEERDRIAQAVAPQPSVGEPVLAASHLLPERDTLPMPKGFFIGKDLGLCMHTEDGDIEITEVPLRVRELLNDRDGESTLVLVATMPFKGDVEIRLPTRDLTSAQKSKEQLASRMVLAKTIKLEGALMSFLRAAALSAAQHTQPRSMVEHLGFQDGLFTEFAVGDTLYHKSGELERVSLLDADAAEAFKLHPQASTAGFREAMDLFKGDGFAAMQFSMGVSAAAPLFELCGAQGGLVHAYSHKSGTGKTTVMRLATALWGRPRCAGGVGLEALERDTSMALYTRLGNNRNMPVVVDEITTRERKSLEELVLCLTQGRDKNRGQVSANALRRNTAEWTTPVFSTGNFSVVDQVSGNAKLSQALGARVLELEFTQQPCLWQNAPSRRGEMEQLLADAMTTHAGICGRAMVQYMLSNKEALRDTVAQVKDMVVNIGQLRQQDRYLASMIALGVVGIKMGNVLGLWDFSEEAVLQEALRQYHSNRKEIQEGAGRADTWLDHLMRTSVDNTITVHTSTDTVAHAPRGELGMRWVKDEGVLQIAKSYLRSWCKEHDLSHKEFVATLRDSYGAEERKVFFLSSLPGGEGNKTRTYVYQFPLLGGAGGEEE
jgi:hypothetical protein